MSKPLRVVGIDPGSRGALALLLDGDPESHCSMPLVKVEDMTIPDYAEVMAKLREYQPHIIVLEHAAARPDQSITAMFNYGAGFGVLLAACLSYQKEKYFTSTPCTFSLVRSNVWTRRMHSLLPLSLQALSAKEKSLECYQRLWPKHPVPKRVRAVHDGICDAMLIAMDGAWTSGMLKR